MSVPYGRHREEKSSHSWTSLDERAAPVVGNGANDVLVLEAAALGVAVIGAEGASSAAMRSADVVCTSVHDALDLLLDHRTLVATLRA